MKEIRLRAKSSSGEPYDVVFTNEGTFFTVFCTCKAGIYGKLCKHKAKFLQGDESMLQNPGDAPALAEIRSWVRTSEYTALLTEHSAIKKEIEAARRKELEFRRTLEKAMKNGIPFTEKA